MSQTHPRGRTRPSWNSSRSRGATSLPRKQRRESAITWHCRSSAPNACSPAAISARNWLKRILSRLRRFPTPSFAPRSSLSSWAALPRLQPKGRRFDSRRPLMQPIVSDDVADVMADVAVAEPLNGTVELAGPEPSRQDELVRKFLSATGDPRTVTTDPSALYYGIALTDQSLTPGDNPRIGP